MFKVELDTKNDIVRLICVHRSNFEDYQQEMPRLIELLRNSESGKFLLDVRDLNRPENHIDPDLAFSTLIDMKSSISKMAVVCGKEDLDEIREVTRVIKNSGKPVHIFSNETDALEWLA